MGIQDESVNFSKRQAQKVFSFTYRVTKDLIDAPVNAALKPLTEVFKKIIGFLAKLPIKAGKYALVEGVVRNITEGKTKLKNLVEKGNTDYVDISNREEFALLKKYCKKYHVEYAVLRSKTDPEQHTIFFKASDANIIQKLLDQVVQEMEQKQKKEQEINENKEQDRSQDIVMGFTNKNWMEFMSLTRAERQEIRNKIYRNIDYPNIQEMTIAEVREL